MEPKQNEKKPPAQPAPEPCRTPDCEKEEEVENPVRIRPFGGPAGTPGHVGSDRIIHPPSTHTDLYPGVHVH